MPEWTHDWRDRFFRNFDAFSVGAQQFGAVLLLKLAPLSG